jgi:hypothetical protein
MTIIKGLANQTKFIFPREPYVASEAPARKIVRIAVTPVKELREKCDIPLVPFATGRAGVTKKDR